MDLITPVIITHDLAPLKLQKAMKSLKDSTVSKAAKHRISAAQAADGLAKAEFNPAIEGANLWSSLRHKEAMSHYDEVARLDIYWDSPIQKRKKRAEKKEKDGADKVEEKEIRCQMAIYEPNGFRLGSKLAETEVDFVVNRIWDLSK